MFGILIIEGVAYPEVDEHFLRFLINSKDAIQFLEKLKSIFIEYMRTDIDIAGPVKRSPDFTVSLNFFAGGVVNLYQVWFCGETVFSRNEIAQVVSKIIKNTSSSRFSP